MRALFLKDAETAPAIQTVEDPAAGAADAVVSLRAAGLNHRELWIAKGQYPGMTLPATLGADGAGVVETVGSDGDQALSGQEVVLYPGLGWGDDLRFPSAGFGLLGMPGPGTIAESIAVPADNLFPKPTHLDFAQAAALPLAGLTAWRGLTTKAGLREGEALLITGIGGGVAMQALDFAVAMGARVWVTSSSQETIDLAVQRGAQGGVVYTDEGWAKTLGKAAGPIDVVFDGGPDFRPMCARWRWVRGSWSMARPRGPSSRRAHPISSCATFRSSAPMSAIKRSLAKCWTSLGSIGLSRWSIAASLSRRRPMRCATLRRVTKRAR